VRVVAAVEFADRLGIDVAGFRANEHAFLEVRLELPLQHDEERRAVVAVVIGKPPGTISAL
jgi:hypothetical protein